MALEEYYLSHMSSVLAAVMPAPNVPVEIREFPEPNLPPGGALLRTALSEVCGTDVHLWHGRLSGVPYPIIPGHVTTGTLDKIHGPLADVTGRRSARVIASRFSMSIAPAAGVLRAPRIARRRDARLDASTASRTRRPKASTADGRRRCTWSPV